jgi:hypothetical protein
MERAEHIREWLWQLSYRIAPPMSREELTGRINLLAVDLAEEFDVGAFTRSSMLQAARNKFWPNFGDLCETLSPFVEQHRESMRLLALPPPRPESREPYDPGPAPDWCFARDTRHLVREAPQARDPIRTIEQQIAILLADATPEQREQAQQAADERAKPYEPEPELRAAAAEAPRPEVKRGPVLVEDDDPDA